MVYRLLCAGSNAHGQLALAHEDDSHHFARVPTFDLQQRFSNARGQLGPSLPADLPSLVFVPLKVAELARLAGLQDVVFDAVLVAACWETSFVVLRPRGGNGSDVLLSFGANDWGERGCAAPSFAVPSMVDLAGAVAGPGKGKEAEPRIRVLQLKAGPRHIVALIETYVLGNLECCLLGWGASRHGQLGAASPAASFPKITNTPRPIPLPSLFSAKGVIDLAIGRDHTVVLLQQPSEETSPTTEGRSLLLLGSNKHGQLGSTCATAVGDGDVPTDSASRPQRQIPSQNLLSLFDFEHIIPNTSLYDIKAVDCTWNSTFLVLSPRPHGLSSPSTATAEPAQPLVVAFGLNSHGQIGTCDDTSPQATETTLSARQPILSGPHLIRLPSPPSTASTSSTFFDIELACGSEHVLALVQPNQMHHNIENECATHAAVYGWGWNEHGNLGLSGQSAGEDLADVWEPRRIWSSEEHGSTSEVVDVWAGNATSWIQVKGEVGGK
ncbi:translation initiation factor IF-2 [Rhodotorula toruloides]|uniref:Translation initiation factor IF-2 n=1 Tax=Rhodotorula toruloides TaxID=5286 RepID=A0A511K9A4_RHOTO|nr:translation initiation factor IF-2 [Rhodotorula toruloides]